jgi:hypothetical protein
MNKRNLYGHVLRDTYYYLQKIVMQAAKENKVMENSKDSKQDLN